MASGDSDAKRYVLHEHIYRKLVPRDADGVCVQWGWDNVVYTIVMWIEAVNYAGLPAKGWT
jgi:hypothetical protein